MLIDVEAASAPPDGARAGVTKARRSAGATPARCYRK